MSHAKNITAEPTKQVPFKSAMVAPSPYYEAIKDVPADFALENVIALLDAVDCSLTDEISGNIPCPFLTRLAVRAAMASVESVLMGLSAPGKGDAL